MRLLGASLGCLHFVSRPDGCAHVDEGEKEHGKSDRFMARVTGDVRGWSVLGRMVMFWWGAMVGGH